MPQISSPDPNEEHDHVTRHVRAAAADIVASFTPKIHEIIWAIFKEKSFDVAINVHGENLKSVMKGACAIALLSNTNVQVSSVAGIPTRSYSLRETVKKPPQP
jgi:hypothetical protein